MRKASRLFEIIQILRLARRPEGWKIRSNTVENLARTRAIGETE